MRDNEKDASGIDRCLLCGWTGSPHEPHSCSDGEAVARKGIPEHGRVCGANPAVGPLPDPRAASVRRCPHYPYPCPPDEEAACVAYERGESTDATMCLLSTSSEPIICDGGCGLSKCPRRLDKLVKDSMRIAVVPNEYGGVRFER